MLARLYPFDNMPTRNQYETAIKKVLSYLSTAIVATVEMIKKETNVKEHQIRRMITNKTLTTSLNYNHKWIIPGKIVSRKKDHLDFYKHRIKKYSRTVPIFHTRRKTSSVLSYLASKVLWGITEEEAMEFLGRDCKRALDKLVQRNAIQTRICNGEKIYVNRIHKAADAQINQRRVNPRFRKEKESEDGEEKDEDETSYITYEEYCEAFRSVLADMDPNIQVTYDRLCALLLQFNTNRSLRTMETWIGFNPRIQNAIEMPIPIDHTTLCRASNDVSEEFLKELFHRIIIKLHDMNVITGKFLVVDATHIYAFRNTRKNTNKYPVEGAKWGEHQGSFYGYKVHILIDAESELPIAMVMSPGNKHDSVYFQPLLEQFDEKYDFDEAIAVLGDAAYDTKSFRKTSQKKTGGKFLPVCNPRRSKSLARLKRMVKNTFDKFGNRIQSVQDGLKFLGQKLLSEFGIDLGTKKESKLVEMISERLHRPFRSAVERVFSRLKSLRSFERPKSRRYKTVIKTVWWCLIGQLVQALTAQKKGVPGSMRKRTMLV